MPKRSTAQRAAALPTIHGLTAAGYVEYAPHEGNIPGTINAPPVLCDPAPADRSHHIVESPRGGRHVMQWLTSALAWAPVPEGKGHRLAFTPAYLGSHGWRYIGPEPDDTDPQPAPVGAPKKRRPVGPRIAA